MHVCMHLFTFMHICSAQRWEHHWRHSRYQIRCASIDLWYTRTCTYVAPSDVNVIDNTANIKPGLQALRCSRMHACMCLHTYMHMYSTQQWEHHWQHSRWFAIIAMCLHGCMCLHTYIHKYIALNDVNIIGDTSAIKSGLRTLLCACMHVFVYTRTCTYIARNDVDNIGDTTGANSGQRALRGACMHVCVYSLSCTYVAHNGRNIIGDTAGIKPGLQALRCACMHACMCQHTCMHIYST